MKLFKIINDNPVPYSLDLFRKDNPRTAFPKQISADKLREQNVFYVAEKPKPELTINQKASLNSLPTKQTDGSWAIEWTIEGFTEEEAREWRNAELDRTDKFMSVSDYPHQADMRTYRQALRDWTESEDFPQAKPIFEVTNNE